MLMGPTCFTANSRGECEFSAAGSVLRVINVGLGEVIVVMGPGIKAERRQISVTCCSWCYG